MLKNKDPRKRAEARLMAAVKSGATAEIQKGVPAKLTALGKKTATVEDQLENIMTKGTKGGSTKPGPNDATAMTQQQTFAEDQLNMQKQVI